MLSRKGNTQNSQKFKGPFWWTGTPTSSQMVTKLPSYVIPLSEPHLLFKANCHSFSVCVSQAAEHDLCGGNRRKKKKKRIVRLSNIFAVEKNLCLARPYQSCPSKSRFLHLHRAIAVSTNRSLVWHCNFCFSTKWGGELQKIFATKKGFTFTI